MEDARRAHAVLPDLLVGSIGHLGDLELDRQVVEVDREEGVVHAEAEELAHRSRLLGAADAKRALGIVGRAEERDALDVIPVQV